MSLRQHIRAGCPTAAVRTRANACSSPGCRAKVRFPPLLPKPATFQRLPTSLSSRFRSRWHPLARSPQVRSRASHPRRVCRGHTNTHTHTHTHTHNAVCRRCGFDVSVIPARAVGARTQHHARTHARTHTYTQCTRARTHTMRTPAWVCPRVVQAAQEARFTFYNVCIVLCALYNIDCIIIKCVCRSSSPCRASCASGPSA
jgi:hypothetical protein